MMNVIVVFKKKNCINIPREITFIDIKVLLIKYPKSVKDTVFTPSFRHCPFQNHSFLKHLTKNIKKNIFWPRIFIYEPIF